MLRHRVLRIVYMAFCTLVLTVAPVHAQTGPGKAGPGKVAIVRAFVAALSQGGAAGVQSLLAPNFTLTLNGSTSSGGAALSLLDSLPKPITVVSLTPMGQIIQSTVPVTLPQASSVALSTASWHMVEGSVEFGSGPANMVSFTGVPGGHILNMTISGSLPLASQSASPAPAAAASTPVSAGPGSGAIVRNFIAALNQGGGAAAQSYLAPNFTLTLNGTAASGPAALSGLDTLPKPIAVASLTPGSPGPRMVQATLQVGSAPALTAVFGGSTSGRITSMTLSGAVSAPSSMPVPAATSSSSPGTSVTYDAGWNLVSGPSGTVLAGTEGPLYTFQATDTSYEVIPQGTALQSGASYWALFSAPATEVLAAGTEGTAISLPPGQFVMVGNPCNATVSLDGADAVFVYSPSTGYVQTETLAPGQGGWAISLGGATLSLACTP